MGCVYLITLLVSVGFAMLMFRGNHTARKDFSILKTCPISDVKLNVGAFDIRVQKYSRNTALSS